MRIKVMRMFVKIPVEWWDTAFAVVVAGCNTGAAGASVQVENNNNPLPKPPAPNWIRRREFQ